MILNKIIFLLRSRTPEHKKKSSSNNFDSSRHGEDRKFIPAAPSNHHPSMLAYPPPPKPEYQKPPPPLDTTPGAIPSSPISFPPPLMKIKIDKPPAGFIPPLPSVPHPDELKG